MHISQWTFFFMDLSSGWNGKQAFAFEYWKSDRRRHMMASGYPIPTLKTLCGGYQLIINRFTHKRPFKSTLSQTLTFNAIIWPTTDNPVHDLFACAPLCKCYRTFLCNVKKMPFIFGVHIWNHACNMMRSFVLTMENTRSVWHYVGSPWTFKVS